MSEAVLTAEIRVAAGTRAAGRARRAGLVPAVVYGLGSASVPVSVPARDLSHILAGGANTLIRLRLEGDEQLAMARQVQRDPVRGTLLHVDLVRVRADVAIQSEVPVHLEGTPEGVAQGGLLEQMLHAVTVEAKPTEIPHAIAHDVRALELGTSVHVRDLVAPPGATIVDDPDDLVAQVSVPRGAEAPEAEAAAEEGEAVPPAEAGGAGTSEE